MLFHEIPENLSKVSNFEQNISDPTCIVDLSPGTYFSSRGFDMSTHIRISGLSYFCTDNELRQAFTPFGTVVLAQVLRDECGHSLGLGIVHMARSEDIERVFNEHQRFKLSDSRVDLWESTEPEDSQGERIMSARSGSSSDGAWPGAPKEREGAQTIDGAQA